MQPTPFIQVQIYFLIKRKKEYRQIYIQAHISMVYYFGDKPNQHLCRGMAAKNAKVILPKIDEDC